MVWYTLRIENFKFKINIPPKYFLQFPSFIFIKFLWCHNFMLMKVNGKTTLNGNRNKCFSGRENVQCVNAPHKPIRVISCILVPVLLILPILPLEALNTASAEVGEWLGSVVHWHTRGCCWHGYKCLTEHWGIYLHKYGIGAVRVEREIYQNLLEIKINSNHLLREFISFLPFLPRFFFRPPSPVVIRTINKNHIKQDNNIKKFSLINFHELINSESYFHAALVPPRCPHAHPH